MTATRAQHVTDDGDVDKQELQKYRLRVLRYFSLFLSPWTRRHTHPWVDMYGPEYSETYGVGGKRRAPYCMDMYLYVLVAYVDKCNHAQL